MEDEETPVAGLRRTDLEVGGPDLGRILSLTDGIFAFAMTLLVLELTLPVLPMALVQAPVHSINGWLGAALIRDIPTFVAYAFAFLIIGVWWMVHLQTFARIRRWDRRLVWMNLVFLMLIAITPFILGILESPSYGLTPVGVAVYAGTEAVTGLLLVAMWFYASEHHRLIDPAMDPALIRYYRELGLGRSAVFLVSFGLAFWNPMVALYSVVLVFVAQLLVRRRHHVQR
jgi:uncharacterized membrane protein